MFLALAQGYQAFFKSVRFAETCGERFYRMWRYYLLSCAGAFRARDIQLWQFVLSKKGGMGGYQRVSWWRLSRRKSH